MSDGTDRCFLAVKAPKITDPYNFLQTYKKEIRMSITKPENYHITTHFFGEVDKSVQSAIIQKIDGLSFDKFEVTIESSGYFPKKQPKFARVLYMGIEHGSDKFQKLYEHLSSRLDGISFAKKNEFTPHITVARIRRGNPTTLVQNWLEFKLDIPFVVDHVTLYKSLLTPSGAEYMALKTWEL